MFQLLVLMLYFSGLWSPPLKSLYIEENQKLKFQLILGDAKTYLGSSVLYSQAQKQRFWADLKAWEQMPKASPSPILVF